MPAQEVSRDQAGYSVKAMLVSALAAPPACEGTAELSLRAVARSIPAGLAAPVASQEVAVASHRLEAAVAAASERAAAWLAVVHPVLAARRELAG
jgi:hypothetical protein